MRRELMGRVESECAVLGPSSQPLACCTSGPDKDKMHLLARAQKFQSGSVPPLPCCSPWPPAERCQWQNRSEGTAHDVRQRHRFGAIAPPKDPEDLPDPTWEVQLFSVQS